MKKNPHILVVDDDPAHLTMLKTLISGWGYTVSTADDGSKAISAVEKRAYDLILMDIRMAKVSGIEALERIIMINPSIPVIIMTAYSSVETAVSALKKGAYDYLTKPLDFEKMKITIHRAMEHVYLKEENVRLKDELHRKFDTGRIIGKSPAMLKLMEAVKLVAASDATVLITGESGTGKELIAGAIHYNSARKNGPFVKLNCAAITETLLESELFGHEKGAFTGADRQKEGRFVQADGGTLFLDEVAEMSVGMQAKLLRVIQERELTRVGGEKVIHVDVRVIAATNRNLTKMIEEKSFREDLYYRLNVVSLRLPPLRDRKEDIPVLALHFLKEFVKKNRKEIKGFSPDAMRYLVSHPWPGNIRELMNTIERGVVLCVSEYLDVSDFQPLDEKGKDYELQPIPGKPEGNLLETAEKEIILKTLAEVGGNKSEAARRLGITRKTLHKKLTRYQKD